MEHPVDGQTGVPEKEEDGSPKLMKTLFYMVVVPTYFEKGLSKYLVYQMISNFEVTHDTKHTLGESILMFNFEFSPITENVT